jgi:hypothetical protein
MVLNTISSKTNGLAERFVQTFKQALKASKMSLELYRQNYLDF